MYCHRVVFSSQAYLSIVVESYDHLDTETGGIFLGKVIDNIWYVLETIDPGYKKIHRSSALFEYDEEYITHVANVRARLYENGLELLGLWHRHPGSFDEFSSTDDVTNSRFCQLRRGAISALVNFDPNFRLTVYHASLPLLQKIKYVKLVDLRIGDSHIPKELFEHKNMKGVTSSFDQRTLNLRNTSQRSSSALSLSNNQHENEFRGSKNLRQEILLEMLDEELQDYLEVQKDYDYKIRMLENVLSIEINMRYLGERQDYPVAVYCKLSLEDQQKVYSINKQHGLYSSGVIRKYVEHYRQEKYYAAILKLPDNYDIEMIKKVYYERAKDYHPDTWATESNPSLIEQATKRFQEIQEAYNFFQSKFNS
jgi:proteasome lid subunit RPN8/RPN11